MEKKLPAATFTLAAGKGGEERTLTLSKEAQVVIDGKAGKLADVPVGAALSGKLSADQKAVLSFMVTGPTFQGVLKEVDADKGKITVNAVLPSTIDTAANRASMPKADFAKWVAPSELAEVILFLASDAASAVTGALIPVNGRV